ncbi:zinc finger CCHC domain-containing protein 8 [Lampetra fluviatilis]
MAASGSGKMNAEQQQQEEDEKKGTASEETERGEVQLRAQLARLQADNDQLRRQVQLLQQSSDLLIPDPVKDGPFLHVLYMDGARSTHCQAELEGILLQLMHQSGGERDPIPSQPSSVVLGKRTKGKDADACIKVVSNVRYYRSFCLDSIGRPLLRGNPAITEGWNIPQYQTIFKQILSNEISEGQAKPQRPKGMCFNCGSEDHIMRTCPQKRDLAGINLRRRQFESFSNSPKSRNPQRYHNEQEERFAHFKPGVISEGLRLALAVAPGQLPPYIYRMRQLDYPPGWLRESCQEGSGITIHGDLSDGEIDESEEAEIEKQKRKAFNPTKLISYPGFNVPLPANTLDDWRTFNSCPMQPQQLKEAMIRRLKEASKKQVKRTAPAEQGSHTTKKQRSRASDDVTFDNSDMDTDSELTSREAPAWPPLPASPGFRAPLPPATPPVPRGTGGHGGSPMAPPPPPPDVTPPPLPKDTPPPSPATPDARSRVEAGAPEQEEEEQEEEALSLEDLEEQQRLIQAALEQSEGTAEPGGVHPAAPSAPAAPAERDEPAGVRRSPRIKVEREGGPSVRPERRRAPRGRSPSAAEAEPSPEPSMGEQLAETPGETPEESSPMVVGGEGGGGGVPSSAGDPPKAPALDEEMEEMVFDIADDDDEAEEEKARGGGGSGGDDDDEAEAVPWRVKNAQRSVPDSSKFAAGITDFTHHLEESGQPTGLYARLRSVLQRAPRKAAKKP